MRIRKLLRSFAADDRGGPTVEYVAIFIFLFAVVMFAFQVAVNYHQILSVEKAAQMGARIAAVRDPVNNNVPARNLATSNDVVGQSCSTGACGDPGGPWVCAGLGFDDTVCNTTAFGMIVNEMTRWGVAIDEDDIVVSYSYGGLGYAGGPFVPLIEVTVVSRPFALNPLPGPALTRPTIIAGAIGEDMSSTY